MSDRTFKVQSPHMHGDDVEQLQRAINTQFKRWKWDHQIKVDRDYGIGTRSAVATVLYGLGISRKKMVDGITPELRTKIRNRQLTDVERRLRDKRRSWRDRKRRSFGAQVSSPLKKVLADSWGYHPGVHDGIDLICLPNATIYAMVNARVVRADAGGWWGLAPSGDTTKGDGIIILRVLENVGPFKKGMNLCYGHAEHAMVKVGDHVEAGQAIGHAGLAVAWHVHFMVNNNDDTRGVGDRDPEPFYRYAVKNDR